MSFGPQHEVRMAERSNALRSGRSPLLWAWFRIPFLTLKQNFIFILLVHNRSKNLNLNYTYEFRAAAWSQDVDQSSVINIARNIAVLIEHRCQHLGSLC
ncbi:hypothetical protein AVEN_92845-1 [Araneus ventricosus]|uniref:Uncharacterized protein n=1 Tax=Araneus ventricosus TaxID=182803 RepID=A0A4Y2XDD9_ARAVE|nr:hypothetical protein AVEN_92845-1 [Araneus ventricosus]